MLNTDEVKVAGKKVMVSIARVFIAVLSDRRRRTIPKAGATPKVRAVMG